MIRFLARITPTPGPTSYTLRSLVAKVQPRCVAATLGLAVVCGLAGCGGTVTTPGGSGDGGGGTLVPAADYPFLTGNWVFQLAPTSGGTPFTTLSGFINETNQEPGIYDLTTMVLQSSPGSNCYEAYSVIPAQGAVKGSSVFVSSFSVNGQFLYITLQKDSTGSKLDGTYLITQGCAAESKGTIHGVRYTSLTGTYTGSIAGTSPAQTVQLALTQASQGTGKGEFYVSGSATFNGPSCFTQGTLVPTESIVIGDSAVLTVTATDGSKVVLSGTFDVAAKTLSLSSIQIVGGSCAAQLGSASLTKQ